MLNILLSGCNGKMGQVVTRLSSQYDNLEIAAGFDITDNGKNPYPVFTDLKSCNLEVDVIIDFSNPAAFDELISFAAEKKIPAVIATTGLSRGRRKCWSRLQKLFPFFIPPICLWESTC
ncbi:MAG: hypothetical protein ACOX4M_08635 [Acetivibrionales bacterium]